jgi:hypothetical protein
MAGNENSGRNPKTEYSEEAKQRLHEGLLSAVAYLLSCVDGSTKRVNPNRVIAAKEVIHQCIGKPTQRIEAEGSVSPEVLKLLEELSGKGKGDINTP